jgi:hypothetical protein
LQPWKEATLAPKHAVPCLQAANLHQPISSLACDRALRALQVLCLAAEHTHMTALPGDGGVGGMGATVPTRERTLQLRIPSKRHTGV